MIQSGSEKTCILVVDDEKDLLEFLAHSLEEENYAVLKAETGRGALAEAKSKHPDLILLDLKLPDIDGYDVCRQLRAAPDTAPIPIIMVSTRSRETEKVVGLELGADDYLTKPYSSMELLARIRAVLRRQVPKAKPEGPPPLLEFGTIVVDTEGRQVKVEGQEVRLTKKEFELLITFLQKPGKVFKREYLLESIWGYDVDSLMGTVDTHVKSLRKKLGPPGKAIETVTGVGYCLRPPSEQH